MDILRQAKKLCEIYNITPSRSKGQNFLISERIYDSIVKAAELKPDDTVLEVGPGLGFLTAKLAKTVKRVIAVELDDKLAQALRDGLDAHGVKNVEVVNEDILKIGHPVILRELATEESIIDPSLTLRMTKAYKVVANLPYNITSIFLRKFLGEAEVKPKSMTLMLQKEVAERIVAKPPRMSVLAVSIQLYAEPKIIRSVSKENFWPAPKVDSSIIKLEVRSKKLEGLGGDEKKFFRLVKHGFSSKRRMLKNNLAGGLKITNEEAEKALLAIGLNPKIRAEGLAAKDWIKLFGELGKYMV
ncbi:MAG: 16S rRNA (adenine(1518)-N(6)/adenine(1519)-N(6))-dimethyltransferase RsmA [Patescibacteria group bacterium]|jgi:16S rRNA (adenine1518-N6/adenine1519-N6)-dimethyltransferase